MDQDVTNLSDHLEILRRRWRLLVAGLVLGVVAGVALSLTQSPLYSSQSTLLLEPDKTTTSATVMDPDEVATQASVIASVGVANRVIKELGLDLTPVKLLDSVTVAVVGQTRTVSITALRPTADEAASVANAFANQYIAYRADTSVESSVATQSAYLTQLSNVRAELATVRQKLAQNPKPGVQSSLEAQEQSLTAREAEISTQLMVARDPSPTATGGHVLLEAQAPKNPAQPRPLRGGALGGLLGLILGTLLAYARDRFDDGIRDEQRLRTTVGAIPVLGRIPEEPAKTTRPVSLLSPHSAGSEAYRSLTTNIRFLTAAHRDSQGGRGELLVVSSAVSGEGKTTLAANIAVTAARVGLRVLVVDADLRDPDLSSRFGIETPVGLSHVLAEQASIEDATTEIQLGIGDLRVIGAGVIPPNPAELLAGLHASAIWEKLRGMADLVVVDTAPILGVADTLEIVRDADLFLLATRYRATRVHQLHSTIERIRQVGGTVDGVAWCAVPGKNTVYGYGGLSPTD